MRYIKFGLGRCMEDAAHEIRDGHITRDEGIALWNVLRVSFQKKIFRNFSTIWVLLRTISGLWLMIGGQNIFGGRTAMIGFYDIR